MSADAGQLDAEEARVHEADDTIPARLIRSQSVSKMAVRVPVLAHKEGMTP